ncbi:MAG TPA: hypothetical protein VFL54_07910 [Gammaproteobacteria bacterium]|nr:hypothetical protein [Gammaproteobacteria bacterium]
MKTRLPCALCGLAFLFATVAPAFGHGFAGKRFFPATLSVEDSFVAPELDFLYSNNRVPGEEGGDLYASGLSAEFAKPLTQNFQLSLGAAYLHQNPLDGPPVNGWDNFELGAKYQVFIDADAESALAVGVEADLGGTGSARVGAESSSEIAPAVYYSKGFGNLSTGWLRPFAITAAVAPTFPTDSEEPHAVEWGLTLQYSLPYLDDFVKDTGLPAPFRNMIPIVEFPMTTCLDRGCAGHTTGTINPGFVWVGKVSQLGFELVIPVNSASGSHVGFLLQYHLYLDDIIPSWSVR